MEEPMVKRAITLGGGGPAAGLHIGVLEALAAHNIEFDVWSLSCIGAWVGIVYNQFDDKIENKDRAKLTHQFFKAHVFRNDESYERFPINSVFGTDWSSNTKALMKYVSDIENYKAVWQPHAMMNAFAETVSMFSDPKKHLDEGDINGWILNQVMAPNPFVRNMMSMMYLSEVNGLSRINYPKSEFMKRINFEQLKKPGMPAIFHNAWNLDKQKLALFSNRPMRLKNEKYTFEGPIDASTLCACSALPFIEGTVEINGVTYCEGALVDTVNFDSLLEEHPDLEEIWISRIVDSKQIQKPENLHDGLANLCQLFAATVGEDDVNLFKYHIRYDPKSKTEEETTKNLKVVEIHVPGHINFKWNHTNLDNGCKLGKVAAEQAIKAYEEHERRGPHNGPHFINEKPGGPDWQRVCEYRDKLKLSAA
jgi:predicted acylesterase/phospholipase RssA